MEVCGGPVWDSAITWYTDDPDFTPCFHLVVLPSVPLVFLFLLSPLEIYFLSTRPASALPSPWCSRNILRLVMTFLLIILSFLSLVLVVTSSKTLFLSNILCPAVDLSSLLLAGGLSWLNIRRGVLSSGIIFSFWAVRTLCQTFTFASCLRQTENIFHLF